jgi:type I restriction enzyme S subunit
MAYEFSAYESYKQTHLGWLSQIPSHWEVKRLKYLGDALIGLTYSPDEVVDEADGTLVLRSSNVQNRQLAFNDNVYVNKKIPEKLVTQKGDILICARNGSRALIGKNAQIDESAVGLSFGAFMSIFRSPYNDYLSKVFNSPLFEYQSGSFLTATINQLTTGNLNSFEIPLPPENEQQRITNFLDHETAKIDTLIEKQQQLIALLKEKRQAVISHAVTKGLNPDAPMRDSGVEWLGDVPEHWGVTRAKFISDIFVPQRNKPELNDSEGISWATMEDMKNTYIEITKQFVSENASHQAGSKTLKSGSVIASCVGNFGVTSINKVDVIINQQLQAFIPKRIKAEYLREIVSISTVYFDLVGTAATLVYVNQQGFENLPVLVPPECEQNDICSFVDQEYSKFKKLMFQCEQAVDLLQERRIALISAAVTGKIDVRHWTP